MTSAVDLFAGAGGWSVACRRLRIREVGVELDAAACATRLEAGFATLRCSVRGLDPRAPSLDADLLLKSPPCQTFSNAGNGSGRAELDQICAAVRNGEWDRPTSDPRSKLVMEPLRWIMLRHRAGRPYLGIAGEQVPPVLPVWKAYSDILAQMGYSTACGILYSECYGVAQTRKRAIFVARLEGEAELPAPTHSRYYSHDRKRLDDGVKKWVSMAEALEWGPGAEVQSNYSSASHPSEYNIRSADEPSATITSKVSRNKVYRNGLPNRKAARRNLDEPAPAFAFGHDSASCGWESEYGARSEPGFTRITVPEAGVLQSFPKDFPWQGTQSEKFQQVGNAIPPLMAEAILRTLL